jgi:cytoskeletal protein CcmA (bactofilin family)
MLENSTPISNSLGEDLTIVGNVASKGKLRLHGNVRGDVNCQALFVSEAAQIKGIVTAQEVIIQGCVVGAVRATEIVLQANCHVEGEVSCHRLTVEQGATFDGESKRML